MTRESVVAAALLALAVFVLLGSSERPAAPSAAGDEASDPASGAGPGAGSAAGAGGARADLPADHGRRRRLLPRLGGAGRATVVRAGDADVSSALALLALAYRSGLPTWDVLDAVAAGLEGPASRDLRQVAAALRWGADEGEAWASVGPAWSPAGRAVAIAHHAGVPPGPMLLAAADDLRDAQLERLELAAAKVGVRLVAPLGVVLLPAFCLTTVAPLVIALAGDVLSG